ncbi:cupin domain-containing protein [Kocuria sp. CPCC 205292]|uniref:cupin domain-containing protein n=1 Tax=Kocuria cellulosilytica TaxID=3071451 RepID=UPI0034D51131
MEPTDDQIEVLRAGRPQHRNPVQRDTVTWLRTGAATGGEHALLHVEVEPGGEVRPHYHRRSGMRLRVLEGTLRVQVGHVVRDLGAGGEAEVPEEHLFRWKNPAGSPARFVLEVRPAHEGFEKGLVALYGLARDGRVRPGGRPRSLLRTALLIQWTDINLPGIYRWLGPVLRALAGIARRRGIDHELEERYCR